MMNPMQLMGMVQGVTKSHAVNATNVWWQSPI